MEKENIHLLIIISFFILKLPIGASDCPPASCGPDEPEVRFPFRIIGRQPDRCSFPGFDLSCDEQNKTIIRLTSSLSYIVNTISYDSQTIYLDAEFCRPNRIVDVYITDPPFSYSTFGSYTFFNCSLQNSSFIYPHVTYPCLSSGNFSVIGALTDFYPGYMPTNCNAMKTIMLPVEINSDMRDTLKLMWYTPYCRSCEKEGKACRLKSDDGETVCVGDSQGVPSSVTFGLKMAIGLSALICIVRLSRYASSRVQGHNDSHNQGIHLSSVTTIPQTASRTGLDGPTIESYPKIVLKDGCRLPNDDRTCAICLCEYKSKESLRTIPECNHYFHVVCIDEWLKLKGTCPVCRNKPESSALVTPCSKTASSTSVDS